MKDLFEIQRRCLQRMGHDFVAEKLQNSSEQRSWEQPNDLVYLLLEKWHSIKHYIALIFVMSAQWPMINYVIYNIDDLPLATASLSIGFTNVLTVIKMFTFLLYKRKFVILMNELSTMYEQLNEPIAKRVLHDANRTATKLVKVYFYTVCSTGMYFMIGPLLKIVWCKVMQKNIVLDLPMPMRFFFNVQSTPGYEIAYVYTGCVTFTVVMYASAVDGLFLSYTINLRAHFQVLQQFMRTDSDERSNVCLRQHFRAYVVYHDMLLQLSNRVRDAYAPIVFGQFLMTSLEVGVIVYQLVTHINSIQVLLVYSCFLSAILIQLLIYCYGGEIVKVESAMIGIAVQLSDWYKLPLDYRRMLCLIMLRSQRAVIIKAGFYEASLANFMAILRAALSFITLIQSIE